MAQKTVQLRVKRQDGPGARPRWEHFEVPHAPGKNVISCLIDIARKPVTLEGRETTPVQWDCACLEEVCGACTMLVNGKPQQSCSSLVDNLEQPIELAPLTKFPVVRDLVVDRQKMFKNLERFRAWVPIDGTYPMGEGPLLSAEDQQVRYNRSRCMTCACCMEVCPQINGRSDFVGPAVIGQVEFFNLHPSGPEEMGKRLEEMMGTGGIHECGNAQNCVAACPKEIDLTDAIAEVGRQVTIFAVKKFLHSS